MSLRVSGLYFAITTFVFTLVLTVLATDLSITGGLQGLLGPTFPDFPDSLSFLGAPVAWCVMLALLIAIGLVWSFRKSPLYPVLLAIRDAEPFAEAAGVRTAVIKVGVFGLSAAMAGGAGWLFSFLGVVSPGQFDWAVSLNILVMVLVGGINTTLGPIVGAMFVTMFPAVVNIDPWLQEILYGALSIFAITLFPEGVVGLAKRHLATLFKAVSPASRPVEAPASRSDAEARPSESIAESAGCEPAPRRKRSSSAAASTSATAKARRCCARSISREARPYPRPDRPQRLRQEHAGEHHRRPPAPAGGNDPCQGRAGGRPGAERARRPRAPAHLPGRPAGARTDHEPERSGRPL